jgi:hypothetical protein
MLSIDSLTDCVTAYGKDHRTRSFAYVSSIWIPASVMLIGGDNFYSMREITFEQGSQLEMLSSDEHYDSSRLFDEPSYGRIFGSSREGGINGLTRLDLSASVRYFCAYLAPSPMI